MQDRPPIKHEDKVALMEQLYYMGGSADTIREKTGLPTMEVLDYMEARRKGFESAGDYRAFLVEAANMSADQLEAALNKRLFRRPGKNSAPAKKYDAENHPKHETKIPAHMVEQKNATAPGNWGPIERKKTGIGGPELENQVLDEMKKIIGSGCSVNMWDSPGLYQKVKRGGLDWNEMKKRAGANYRTTKTDGAEKETVMGILKGSPMTVREIVDLMSAKGVKDPNKTYASLTKGRVGYVERGRLRVYHLKSEGPALAESKLKRMLDSNSAEQDKILFAPWSYRDLIASGVDLKRIRGLVWSGRAHSVRFPRLKVRRNANTRSGYKSRVVRGEMYLVPAGKEEDYMREMMGSLYGNPNIRGGLEASVFGFMNRNGYPRKMFEAFERVRKDKSYIRPREDGRTSDGREQYKSAGGH